MLTGRDSCCRIQANQEEGTGFPAQLSEFRFSVEADRFLKWVLSLSLALAYQMTEVPKQWQSNDPSISLVDGVQDITDECSSPISHASP